MVRLISRQRGGLAVLKLTKLFGIDDFPAAKDSGKVLIIIIYCYLIIIIIEIHAAQRELCQVKNRYLKEKLDQVKGSVSEKHSESCGPCHPERRF